MKIIVPMAGRGSRLRPHTLTVPKPLVHVAGKPIVHRLVEDIAEMCDDNIEEIAFIIGDFGKEAEAELLMVAEKLGAKGSVFYQKEPLGTAHAVLCASEKLSGPVIVAFADTLFKAEFKISEKQEGIIWVKQIDDPSAFGVVKMNQEGAITDFIEKPKEYVSDLAMIGIYYFKSGESLKTELDYLIDNDLRKGGEYQLPDALRRLTEKGTSFIPGKVTHWLDCGNKNATVETNQSVLNFEKEKGTLLVNTESELTESIIIEPCFIGKGAKITRSVIGPHVSVGAKSEITDSIVSNSIIQQNTLVSNMNFKDSMIGAQSKVNGTTRNLSIGDYTEMGDAN
jgi:glucose-1-phosphate thymidylyltransferase